MPVARQLVAFALVSVGVPLTGTAQPVVEDTLIRPTTITTRGYFGFDLTSLGEQSGTVGFAVGAPQVNADGLPGEAYIYSVTGGVVQREHTLVPPGPIDDADFGYVVRGVPDVTGDGRMDLLVSAPLEEVPNGLGGTSADGGAVYVYNGATGALLVKMIDPFVSEQFGRALGWVPDVTGDGVPDILTGSPRHSTSTMDWIGRASVRNGATWQTVLQYDSPVADDAFNRFGSAVLGMEDLDGDGLGDVAIGEAGTNSVHVLNGATGSVIYTATVPSGAPNANFGSSLALAEDHDGDGVRDIWVGARLDLVARADGLDTSAGQVYLISGATGDEILRLDRPNPNGLDNFGRRVESAGDLDGDGTEDVLVGVGDVNVGVVARAYSGATGEQFLSFGEPMNGSLFGESYIHAGDLDGNGTPDLIIGNPTYWDSDAGEPFAAGGAFVYLSNAADASLAGSQGWRLLSAPLTGTSYESLLGGFWTQGYVGADLTSGSANVFTYDEAVVGDKGAGWAGVPSQGSTPVAGQGIAYYAFTDDDQIAPGIQGGFPKTLTVGGFSRDVEIALPVTFTDTGSLADDGWNLLGNPFAGAIDWGADGWTRQGIDNVVYVWDAASETYQTWNGTTGTLPDGTIDPFEGFWVKAFTDAGLDVRVAPEAQSSASSSASAPALVLEASATVGSEARSGKAAVMVHPDALAGHDALDAYALTPLAPSYLALHTLDSDGAALDINALPPSDTELAIPLDVWAVDDGSFASATVTLRWPDLSSLPDDWSVTLLDTQTGVTTDLRQRDEVAFSLGSAGRSAGDSAPMAEAGPPTPQPLASSRAARRAGARFVLQISGQMSVDAEEAPALSAGIERVQPNPVASRGVLVVRAAEAGDARLSVFDALGREVAVLHDGPMTAGRHEIGFEVRELAAGPYVVRWQSGSSVDTRTLTVVR